MEGNLHFKIDWASHIVGSKFTVFALFYFVFEGNFPSTSPRGAYIWRGDLTEGFLRYRFGGLIFGGVYTWRGLFSEFYVIMLFYKVKKFLASIVQIVRSRKHDGELSDNKTETKLKEITIPSHFPSIPSPQPNPTLRSVLFFAPSTNTLTPWQTKVAFHLSEMNGRPIPSLPRSLFFGCHAKNGCEGD